MSRISMDALVTSIDTFKNEVNTVLEAVKHALVAGEYQTAVNGMNTLTQQMAKTNVAMRAILIQGKHIDTE